MSLFSKKVSKEKKPTAKKKSAGSDAVLKPVILKSDVQKKASAMNAPLVLKSPHVSEKAAMLSQKGTYVFDVPLKATKNEVCKAVESIYSVHVSRVNIIRGKGKVVRRGRIEGVRSDWKKALVTLKMGEKIELYDNV